MQSGIYGLFCYIKEKALQWHFNTIEEHNTLILNCIDDLHINRFYQFNELSFLLRK